MDTLAKLNYYYYWVFIVDLPSALQNTTGRARRPVRCASANAYQLTRETSWMMRDCVIPVVLLVSKPSRVELPTPVAGE